MTKAVAILALGVAVGWSLAALLSRLPQDITTRFVQVIGGGQ